MLEQRRLKRIISIIESYDGEIPLQHFLRNYFRQHREMGSSDRKIATQSIYDWFRIGKALSGLKNEERLAVAAFLCGNNNDLSLYLLDNFTKFKRNSLDHPLANKISIVQSEYPEFKIEDIFPFTEFLSKNLHADQFVLSILQQPYVWLRAKEKELLLDALNKNKITYIEKENAIGIIKPISLAGIPGLNEEWYEVQDLNSHRTGEYFQPESGEYWYDCCAASGGKSLLLFSLMNDISLAVSDNRESILQNLKERFRRNNLKKFNRVIADLEKELPQELNENSFDGIIADVPCSGSGTWSRSPEQISYFNTESIMSITARQKKIIEHVIPLLKKGKPFIYITCSVFKAENEEMVDWIAETFSFKIEKSALLQGSAFHADTIFVARLIKQ